MLKSRFIVRCATLATAAWLCCGAGAHAQTSFANPTKAVEGLKLAVKGTDPLCVAAAKRGSEAVAISLRACSPPPRSPP